MSICRTLIRSVVAFVLGFMFCLPVSSALAAPVYEYTQKENTLHESVVSESEDAIQVGDGSDSSVSDNSNLEGDKISSREDDVPDETDQDRGVIPREPNQTDSMLNEPPLSEGEDAADVESASVACPLAAGVYLIQPAMSSSRVFDILNGSYADGAIVQLWNSNMSGAQRFEVAVGADGYAVIKNVQSGKVLDVAGGAAKSGTSVWQYSYNGSKAQKWRVIDNNDGTYSLESALSDNLVLDVYAAADSDGSQMQVYTANKSKAQKFSFIGTSPMVEGGRTIADGVYEIESMLAEGKNLDISAASSVNGSVAQLYSSNHTLAQRFLVQMDTDGFYRIQAVHSGKFLDVNMGNLVPGAKVHQWDGGSTANQSWAVRENVDGTVTFVNKANAQALDVRWAQKTNGTPLQAYTDNGSAAQKWNLVPIDSLVEEGYYSIKSRLGSNRSLDIAAGSAAQGANLQIWSWNGSPAQRFKLSMSDEVGVFTLEVLCSGNLITQKGDNVLQTPRDVDNPASQQWRAVPSAAGGISFINIGSGLALDVYGAGDWNGNNAGAYQQNGTVAQSFLVEKVDVIGNGIFVLRPSGGCALDVAAGSRSNGANVQSFQFNDSGAQKWNVRAVRNGWYILENARSKKALDVAERSLVSGANVQQWETTNAANQLWRIDYAGGGRYTLTSALGALSLNADGGGSLNGQNITVRNADSSIAQQFRLEASTYTQEDFSDRIASFSTYSTNDFAGTYNMQRALNSFNGYIIWPGQTMSFFGVAGPCGAAQGYLPAGVVGGVGYGGGICQASTTLYGASIRAGLTIVERRNHSVPSTYVPIGLDAMVDYGSSDFKVRNDFDFPIKIVSNTPGNRVQADMYGIQPEWYDYIEPQSWWTGSKSASAQRTYYKSGNAVYVERLRDSFY